MMLRSLRMMRHALLMMLPVWQMMRHALLMMLPVWRMMRHALRTMRPVWQTVRRIAAAVNRATEQWRGPVLFGFVAAAALWIVWFFTNPPCTIDKAAAGACHPGTLARYINHEIMAHCLLVGMAAATLKGGYDQLMLNRERKRADEAEERVKLERQRLDEERQLRDEDRQRNEERIVEERRRSDARIDAMRAEMREDRQQWQAELHEERQQRQAELREERQQRQAMMDTFTQLLSGHQNGNTPKED